MTTFIEVTRNSNGKTLLINTAAIDRVHDMTDWRRITFRGGTGAAEAETIDVSDTYSDLRRVLKATGTT